MVAVHLVDALEAPLVDHRLRTSRPLLCRLEEEPHRTVARQPRCTPLEQRGGADQAGHVAIVAAEVRDAFVARAVRQPILSLCHAQRVHVRAKGDHLHRTRRGRSRPGSLDVSHEAGGGARPDRALGYAGEFDEQLFEQRLRLVLLKAWLRVGVDLTPHRCHRGEKGVERLRTQNLVPAETASGLRQESLALGEGEGWHALALRHFLDSHKLRRGA